MLQKAFLVRLLAQTALYCPNTALSMCCSHQSSSNMDPMCVTHIITIIYDQWLGGLECKSGGQKSDDEQQVLMLNSWPRDIDEPLALLW